MTEHAHIYDHDRRYNGSAPGRWAVCGARMPDVDPPGPRPVCPDCLRVRDADRGKPD